MDDATMLIDTDPFKWWANNAYLYPQLAKAAAVVLSAPPDSHKQADAPGDFAVET
jgi:hypothetical protein